jgi:hypothetical protein
MDRGPVRQGTLPHKIFSQEAIDPGIPESNDTVLTVLKEKLIFLLMFGMPVSVAMSYFFSLKMMRR